LWGGVRVTWAPKDPKRGVIRHDETENAIFSTIRVFEFWKNVGTSHYKHSVGRAYHCVSICNKDLEIMEEDGIADQSNQDRRELRKQYRNLQDIIHNKTDDISGPVKGTAFDELHGAVN